MIAACRHGIAFIYNFLKLIAAGAALVTLRLLIFEAIL
jgi:hypothetical protein